MNFKAAMSGRLKGLGLIVLQAMARRPPASCALFAYKTISPRPLRQFCFILACLPTVLHASQPLFKIELALGETSFPNTMGWYDPPITRFVSITNQSGATMPINTSVSPPYQLDTTRSTCSSTLNQGSSCQLAVVFNPSTRGSFTGKVQVCAHGLWCSVDPVGFNITVINNDIVSTSCNAIKSRPFSTLDCESSSVYAENFKSFLSRVLHVSEPTAFQHFNYFQHLPSANETTTPCLDAHPLGVSLDPAIKGGGEALCTLMGYATSNSSSAPSTSKQFPPYLTLLLGTAYPILPNTVALAQLPTLLSTFAQPVMDPSIQSLGYDGYINFLSNYLLEQTSRSYTECTAPTACPSLYYLPYQNQTSNLTTWPPEGLEYWGMSGGGGSGAGYQIEAFKPGSTTHYTLFSGGGGGGAGETTPENLTTPPIQLINTGSGGGGGSQFADCFVRHEGNLSGLGLGAGTGSGLSAPEGGFITYQQPPATAYTFYPPTSNPSLGHEAILSAYGLNLDYLFNTLIPWLYDNGYTIAITGGGGGGSGMEYLNSIGEAYTPQPVSIGYGFNFCYVFNKKQEHTASDCISSANAGSKKALILDNIIYKNIGPFYNQGMTLALSACPGGYSNFQCTCSFQNAYVMCELSELLLANGFSSSDIPTWLINPHCNDTMTTLIESTAHMSQLPPHSTPNNCAQSIQNFYQAKINQTCSPPWPLS